MQARACTNRGVFFLKDASTHTSMRRALYSISNSTFYLSNQKIIEGSLLFYARYKNNNST
jgi:hypothetical protein